MQSRLELTGTLMLGNVNENQHSTCHCQGDSSIPISDLSRKLPNYIGQSKLHGRGRFHEALAPY